MNEAGFNVVGHNALNSNGLCPGSFSGKDLNLCFGNAQAFGKE